MEGNSNSSLPSTFASVSDEERRRYLDSLQARDNLLLIPTVVFLATVAIVGFVGNSLVLLAYWRKARRNATDVFIMAIAAFDLLTNVLALPNEIYDTFHYWDFDTPFQCKMRVYVNAFTTMTSALALLAVAITRYKKICRPFGSQTSVKTAKIMSILIVAVCSLCAVPQPILYGLKTRETARIDIRGHECDIADEYLHTIWPMIFASFLMVLFMLVYIPLIVLYVLVGIQAWKHSRRHGISVIARSQSTSEHTDITVNSEDATNATVVLSQRKSLGLSFFKRKKNECKIPHQSGGASKEESHELERKPPNIKDTEPETTETMQQHGNHSQRLTPDTENHEPIVKPLQPNDAETTKSMELQKLHQSNECTDSEHNTSAAEEQNTVNANAYQLSCGNEETEDHGRHRINSKRNSEEIDEVKSCENIHVPTNGFTKSDKRNSEDISDVAIKSKNILATPKNNELDSSSNIAHEVDNDKILQENNRISLVSKPRKQSRSKSVLQKRGHSRRVLNRTTVMLITITSVYVIAFLPYLVLVSLKFTSPMFYENLSPAGESLYNVFLRFFFINSAANAVIYSICDPRFRLEVVNIFKCRK